MQSRNYYITLALLFAVMLFFVGSAFRATNAVVFAADEARVNAAPDVSLVELHERFNAIAREAEAGFVTVDQYFSWLTKVDALHIIARKASLSMNNRLEASQVSMQLNGLQRQYTEALGALMRTSNPQEINLARQAYNNTEALERARFSSVVAYRPLGSLWLLTLLMCMPFAIVAIGMRLHARGLSTFQVAMHFLSDWRPWVALVGGPVGAALYPRLNDDQMDLRGRLRLITHATALLVSCFAGGGGAVVKAQVGSSPASGVATKSKKASASTSNTDDHPWELSIAAREQLIGAGDDTRGTGVEETILATLTHTPSKCFGEVDAFAGRRSVVSYVIGGCQAVKRTWGSIKPVIGWRRVGGAHPVTNYVVAGVRARAAWRRFAFAAPLVTIEQPVTRGRPTPPRTSFFGLLRPQVNVTKRFTLVNEWILRKTLSKPTAVTTGGYVVFTPRNASRPTFEFGAERSNMGGWSLRFQIGLPAFRF